MGIGFQGILIASGLVLLQAGLSRSLRLQLEYRILVSALRALIQLFLVGFILRLIFVHQNPWVLTLVLSSMVLTATQTVSGRIHKPYRLLWLDCFLSITIHSLGVLFFFSRFILDQASPLDFREIIPLGGMIIGNSLSAVSLSLDQFTSLFISKRAEIETWLSLGATRWEAVQELVRAALRTGLTPILNAMSVAGVVSLPGALTGQLLAGADPMHAVKYQIVILFLLLGAAAMGSVCVVLLAYRRLMSPDHRYVRQVG